MKINVKHIQYLNCEYDGTKSELINDIFKDIFGYSIYQCGINFEYLKDKNILLIQADTSVHGSLCFETIKEIKKQELIDLYFSLIDVHEKLLNYENKKK